MSIGDRLRKTRKSKGLSLREVGADTGLSYSGLAEIERGERSCNTETLKILANYYNVSTDYLVFDNPQNQLNGTQLALYNGTKDLNDSQLQEILNFVEFVKSKK